MAIGISAWLDPRAEQAVRDVWRAVAEAGLDRSLHDGPYRPHVTLGIWDVLPLADATAALRHALAGRAPVAVTFEIVGVFVAPRPAAFLAPTVSHELRDLHGAVHAAVGPPGRGRFDRYLPGAWNPHCTLAWRMPAAVLPRAVEVALAAAAVPLHAVIDRVGVIDTPAEVELGCVPLAR